MTARALGVGIAYLAGVTLVGISGYLTAGVLHRPEAPLAFRGLIPAGPQ
jgi:hypothetical protein